MITEKRRNPLIGSNKPNWNIYDLKDNPEYWLAESYATEFVDISGIEVVYYIRDNNIPADPLYGETPTKGFETGRATRMVYEVGEIPTLYSMFGMVATDNIVAHIPRSTWFRDISISAAPKPGDAIIIPWYTNDYNSEVAARTFEVTHAAHDQAIFQLRSLVHVLYLRPYRFSEESQSARDISSDLSTLLPGISAFGDNEWVEANRYDDPDVDESVYGGG